MAKRVSIFAGLLLWAGAPLWWGYIYPGAYAVAADGAPDAAPAVQCSPLSVPGHAEGQTPFADSPARQEMVRAILAMRELENVKFEVPVDLFRDYLAARDGAGRPDVPVAMIAEDSRYQVMVADGGATLDAKLTIRVLDHTRALNLPVLCGGISWDKISVDGDALSKLPGGAARAPAPPPVGAPPVNVKLATVDRWLVWSPRWPA